MIARTTAVLLALGALIAVGPAHGWVRFHSVTYRFFVYYPPGWSPLEPGLPVLDAINFPRSEAGHGSILTQDGAQLIVGPVPQPAASIGDAVASSLRFVHDPPSIDQTILTGLTGENDCRTIRQVEYHVNYGTDLDPVLQHETDYYCEVHNRVFAVRMTYWRGNKDAALLNSFARTAAVTLTIYK